jgi:hypothetical protein
MFSQFQVLTPFNTYNQTLHPSGALIWGSCLKFGSLGCVHHPAIIYNEGEATSEVNANNNSNVLLVLESWHKSDWSKSPWHKFIYQVIFCYIPTNKYEIQV